MAGNRFRYVDYWHFRYLNETASQKAADEIIANPETHLLTQEQLNEAEGGLVGFGAQLATVGLGLGILFAARPRLLTYLRQSQLRATEWGLIGATAFASYRVGYTVSTSIFGDS